jgi:hypothetical protein
VRALPDLNLKTSVPAAAATKQISSKSAPRCGTYLCCRYLLRHPPPTSATAHRHPSRRLPQSHNSIWGCRFAEPAAPFTAVEPSGWPTVATCRSKTNPRSLCRAPLTKACLLKHVCPKLVTAIALSLAETKGPRLRSQKLRSQKLRLHCAHKVLCVRGKNHTRRGRPCPARTEAKQELFHQPGAAPPSSSTGRQLNSSGGRILSGVQQSPLKLF